MGMEWEWGWSGNGDRVGMGSLKSEGDELQKGWDGL